MAVPSSERRRSAYFRPTTEILLTLFLATASASHPRPSPRSECRQPPPNSSGSLTDGLLGRYASEKRLTGKWLCRTGRRGRRRWGPLHRRPHAAGLLSAA